MSYHIQSSDYTKEDILSKGRFQYLGEIEGADGSTTTSFIHDMSGSGYKFKPYEMKEIQNVQKHDAKKQELRRRLQAKLEMKRLK
jgi:hypothetical protein